MTIMWHDLYAITLGIFGKLMLTKCTKSQDDASVSCVNYDENTIPHTSYSFYYDYIRNIL